MCTEGVRGGEYASTGAYECTRAGERGGEMSMCMDDMTSHTHTHTHTQIANTRPHKYLGKN